jgi:hypothetical protein
VAAATVLYHGGMKLGMECKQNRIKVTYENYQDGVWYNNHNEPLLGSFFVNCIHLLYNYSVFTVAMCSLFTVYVLLLHCMVMFIICTFNSRHLNFFPKRWPLPINLLISLKLLSERFLANAALYPS